MEILVLMNSVDYAEHLGVLERSDCCCSCVVFIYLFIYLLTYFIASALKAPEGTDVLLQMRKHEAKRSGGRSRARMLNHFARQISVKLTAFSL